MATQASMMIMIVGEEPILPMMAGMEPTEGSPLGRVMPAETAPPPV